MPMCCEHHRATFAKNGFSIKDGGVMSWDRYYEQFKYKTFFNYLIINKWITT